MFGGTIAAVDGNTQACLDVTGRAASRLLRFAMRARQQALDQIAAAPMTLAGKQARLERSARTIARAVELTKRRILAAARPPTSRTSTAEAIDDVSRPHRRPRRLPGRSRSTCRTP